MKFSVRAMALASGLLSGISMFLMTLWVIVLGDGTNALLESLSTFYIGYAITYKGAVIGLIYGAIDGLIFGAIFGWLYNFLANRG